MEKAKMVRDIPIDTKHGAFKGKIFSIIRCNNGNGRGNKKYILMGEAGEEFSVYSHEIEILESDS